MRLTIPAVATDPNESKGTGASGPKAEEPPARYPLEDLIEGARGYLDVPPYLAAGAFSDVKTQTLTLDDAKEHLAEFLKRPIETESDKLYESEEA